MWNELPEHIRNTEGLNNFRQNSQPSLDMTIFNFWARTQNERLEQASPEPSDPDRHHETYVLEILCCNFVLACVSVYSPYCVSLYVPGPLGKPA